MEGGLELLPLAFPMAGFTWLYSQLLCWVPGLQQRPRTQALWGSSSTPRKSSLLYPERRGDWYPGGMP